VITWSGHRHKKKTNCIITLVVTARSIPARLTKHEAMFIQNKRKKQMKDKKQSRNLLSIYQEKGTILQNRKWSLMQKNKKLQLRQRKHRKSFIRLPPDYKTSWRVLWNNHEGDKWFVFLRWLSEERMKTL